VIYCVRALGVRPVGPADLAITAMLQAGLGNQLFIYGAALSMARRLNVNLHLDTSLFRFDVRRDFELNFFDTGASRIAGGYELRTRRRQNTSNLPAKFAQYLTIRKLSKNKDVLMEGEKIFDSRVQRWGDNTKLLGYFQSWLYLEPVKDEIRQRVVGANQIDASTHRWVSTQQALINSLADPVIVHLRRGDYLLPAHREFHGILGLNYYERALALMAKNFGYSDLVVVSDDLSEARKMFAHQPAIFLEQPPELADSATLLAVCGARKYVIANSSFSWWWAWLSGSAEVVAPRDWFARQDLDSSDVCPPDWCLI
jgi:hypothetical protein